MTSAPLNLGYIALASSAAGYRGGLLVVDRSGDPLDFVVTDPVTLSRLLATLLGARLPGHLLAREMVAPLLDAAAVWPNILCFDEPTLASRAAVFVAPTVLRLARGAAPANRRWRRVDGVPDSAAEWWAPATDRYDVSATLAREAATRMIPLGLAEPFERLRHALGELPS